MSRVLGLDLGSHSIGWALIDEPTETTDGQIIALGSRVFPEGVANFDTAKERPKGQDRRIARGMRRQIARRARRKKLLRRALVECGLLPSEPERQRELDALEPYDLRRRAIEEKLELHEIGRLLIHLNQRRGFLSNRKADRARADENSEMLTEINELAAKMGDQTLGQYFAEKQDANLLDRVRGKHTRRQMYLDEFEKIWETQRLFYPERLTDELKYGRRGKLSYPRKPERLPNRKSNDLLREYGLHGILFFQRTLRPVPKSVVGRCELEPKQRRCPKADRVAQRFRLLHEVNNLRIIPQKGQTRELDANERQKVIDFLAKSKERSFDNIRECLGLLEGDGFNLEVGRRRKLLGILTDAILSQKKLFGSKWRQRSEDEKNTIVRSLIDDDEEPLRHKALTEWGCSPEIAERLIEIDLGKGDGKGYMAYSREAIEKLLPYMERGLPLATRDGTPCALAEAGYLRPHQRVPNPRNDLPPVSDDIANPLVRQALFEVRKLVNAVLREYGKPDKIHIELLREVKGSRETRLQESERMREREEQREAAANFIRSFGCGVTRDAIERVMLWKEQREECFYSFPSRTISPQQLLGGEVEIDHILPYSRCPDNSQANKVLCFRSENGPDGKGQRTPYEWLANTNPEKFAAILQRAAKLPLEIRNRKRQKLLQPSVEIEDFLNRHFSDSAFIASKVLNYVGCLDCEVVATKGQWTYELRWHWGLDNLLRNDGLKLKNREDHRHHAIDAVVVALTDRSRLRELARTRGIRQELPLPWANFRHDVERMVNSIVVSHRGSRKIAGALHAKTIYGPTSKPHRANGGERPHAAGWVEMDKVVVYRKPLELLTTAMIDHIRDPQVKSLVIARLNEKGFAPATTKEIPREVWAEPLLMIRKAGRKATSPQVIKKVRILENDKTIRPIRNGTAYVKPDRNHHIAIFELPGSTPQKRMLDLEPVSMIDAIERVNRKEPVVKRTHSENPEAKFLMSLSLNEMVLLKHEGNEVLCRFESAAGTSHQMWFRIHTFAVKSADKRGRISKKPSTFDGVKVTVDVLGRIRRAND